MGQKYVPPYANNCMAKNIDTQIENIAKKYTVNGVVPLRFFKRFLDDLFLIFVGSTKKLHQFLKEVNKIHSSIHFTMSHTSNPNVNKKCECEKLKKYNFLTQCAKSLMEK